MSRLPFPMRSDIDEYYQTDDILDFLGQGTFASVYKAICRFDGERVKMDDEVALKVINKKDLNTDKAIKDVTNEIEILRRVDHPNCVRLLDFFQTSLHVVIVMSFASGKELFQALRENEFSEACARGVMSQLLSALAYLHDTLRIVHRDVKPENILVNPLPSGEYHMTLVDFGLARAIGRKTANKRLGGVYVAGPAPVQRLSNLPPRSASMESLGDTDSPLLATPCGTLKYAAPETIHSISESTQLSTTRELLPRLDVYAAGTIMYVMLCGALPFTDFANRASLYREMVKGPTFTGPRWANVSPEAIELNRTLLVGDPTKRPRAEDALCFAWLSAPGRIADLRSPNTPSLRLPVDDIIGERARVTQAFDAMRAPETLLENGERMEAAGLPPGGRVRDVPFGEHMYQRTHPPARNYFDFC